MASNRDTTPRVFGVLMSRADTGIAGARWFLRIPEIDAVVNVERVEDGGSRKHLWWVTTIGLSMLREGMTMAGQQAAATAAENWIVEKAERALKLAGRRAE